MTATLPEQEAQAALSASPANPTNNKAPVNIFEKAICLNLQLRALGSSKKLSPSQIEVDADKSLIRASKTVAESKELQAIKTLQGQIRQYVGAQCLPSLFRSGIYLLPIASIATVDERLRQFQGEQEALVEAFLAVYPALIELDKTRLRGVFNPNDYPPASKVRSAFSLDWNYVSFGVPPELSGVDSDIFKREQEKAALKLAEATNMIQDVLRAEMADLVNHMAERLEGGRGEGKPKIFKDTLVSNVKDFLATFSARNITDDAELDKLCDQARSLLDGVDPQALRDQVTTRERVQQGFAQIKAQLDTMLVTRPSRMIKFADEERGADGAATS